MIDMDAMFVNGKRQRPHSSTSNDVICPSTEGVIGRAPDGDDVDVNAAVSAARSSFDSGDWHGRPVSDRAEIIVAALDSLMAKVDEISDLVTSEMGMPIELTKLFVPDAISMGKYYAGLAVSASYEELRPGKTPALVWKEPIGVVASIAPWNGPFNVAVNKIIPALLAGCSVVYKPAQETPLDVFYLADALAEAGLPSGALNVLPGGRETGSMLVSHPDVDKVSFTGSTQAGRSIGEICGRSFKRLQLELGGKSAAIVLEDADLDTTMAGLAQGSFINSGQACLSYSRVLAPQSRYEEIVEALCHVAENLVVGDPFEAATTQGPLVAERQRARVESYIALGQEEGAKLMTGGRRPAHLPKGWYIEPTVFANATNKMRISREEIFGPVVVVIPYRDVEEAIKIANDSDYGLHGGIFTGDDDAALRIAHQIRTGTLTINGFCWNSQAPFGGVKNSGIGRDTGKEAIESFLELKTVNVTPSIESRYAGDANA